MTKKEKNKKSQKVKKKKKKRGGFQAALTMEVWVGEGESERWTTFTATFKDVCLPSQVALFLLHFAEFLLTATQKEAESKKKKKRKKIKNCTSDEKISPRLFENLFTELTTRRQNSCVDASRSEFLSKPPRKKVRGRGSRGGELWSRLDVR